MGVASGEFFPSDHYRRDDHATVDGIASSGLVVLREDGREVGPNAGVPIWDDRPQQDEHPLWIDVIGLDSVLYAELFPEQTEE